jgi:energy-converting hydrogenase Eha subunit C
MSMTVAALMPLGLVTVILAARRRLPLPRLASLLKALVSVTLCIALLHVLSGRRDATAVPTGTTTSLGKAGVAKKNQMM